MRIIRAEKMKTEKCKNFINSFEKMSNLVDLSIKTRSRYKFSSERGKKTFPFEILKYSFGIYVQNMKTERMLSELAFPFRMNLKMENS